MTPRLRFRLRLVQVPGGCPCCQLAWLGVEGPGLGLAAPGRGGSCSHSLDRGWLGTPDLLRAVATYGGQHLLACLHVPSDLAETLVMLVLVGDQLVDDGVLGQPPHEAAAEGGAGLDLVLRERRLGPPVEQLQSAVPVPDVLPGPLVGVLELLLGGLRLGRSDELFFKIYALPPPNMGGERGYLFTHTYNESMLIVLVFSSRGFSSLLLHQVSPLCLSSKPDVPGSPPLVLHCSLRPCTLQITDDNSNFPSGPAPDRPYAHLCCVSSSAYCWPIPLEAS